MVVSKAKQHPEKALRIIGKNKKYITTYIDKNPLNVGSKLNRQQFSEAFFRSNILVCKRTIIEKYNSLSSKKNGFIITPYLIDIDNAEDFNYAKYLIKKIIKVKKNFAI